MKLYQDKRTHGWEPPIYHGRYKKHKVKVRQSPDNQKWYFVVYADEGRYGHNSRWNNVTYNTKEEAAEGAAEWIDRSEGK